MWELLQEEQDIYGKVLQVEQRVNALEEARIEGGAMINTFRVGCDPEFVAFSTGGHPLNLANYLQHEGEIGYDHNGRVAEVRPQPAIGTYALLRRLQKLLRDDRLQLLPARRFRAGAYVPLQLRYQPLGGHVHLDIRPRYELDEYGERGHMDSDSYQRVCALDRITQELEALDILPQMECQARRHHGGYGRYGDVRVNGHLEYRSMASWLFDPRVAYLCLTSAKLAAAVPETVKDKLPRAPGSFEKFKDWMEVFKSRDANADRAVRLLEKGHKALIVDPDTNFRERWVELGV